MHFYDYCPLLIRPVMLIIVISIIKRWWLRKETSSQASSNLNGSIYKRYCLPPRSAIDEDATMECLIPFILRCHVEFLLLPPYGDLSTDVLRRQAISLFPATIAAGRISLDAPAITNSQSSRRPISPLFTTMPPRFLPN